MTMGVRAPRRAVRERGVQWLWFWWGSSLGPGSGIGELNQPEVRDARLHALVYAMSASALRRCILFDGGRSTAGCNHKRRHQVTPGPT